MIPRNILAQWSPKVTKLENFLLRQRAIWPKIMQPYDLLAQGFFESSMMGYKRPMQCWSTSPKDFLLVDRVKPNLDQNYATLSDDLLSEIFFLKRCCKIEHNRHTKLIVNFPGNYILGKMGNLGPIWAELRNLYKDLFEML